MSSATSISVFIRKLSPQIRPVGNHGSYVVVAQSYPSVDLTIHFDNLDDIETFAFKLLSEIRRVERTKYDRS